ncbi:cytochrome c3 family protein [Ketobacter sp.]|uniref:cytochrome c3 family protein n=1 Tax=Ketobacter sp. TaxID=2083498 RepID=UPI0025BA7CFF|nr:cytochrome c3 family protein [Ketobacter sp.]
MKKVTLFYSLLTVAVVALAGIWANELFLEPEKQTFLVGETSHGHHQIELACGTCHQSPFGGGEVLQDACMGCHAKELKAAHDSHPKSKFTDPRNADRLEQIDARYCVACHREHQPDITRDMGVTLATDFCVACHLDIAEDRPSHEGMGFDTCASAGCHNFHDNRALYEDFLLQHVDEPDMAATPVIAAMQAYVNAQQPAPKQAPAPDYPEASFQVTEIEKQWLHSAHATEDSNCSACHGEGEQFKAQPDALVCVDCHQPQAAGFLIGKHGMRLAVKREAAESYPLNPSLKALMQPDARLLTPMTPAQGRLPFKADVHGESLTCNSCHGAHEYSLGTSASVDACMGCHDDGHTNQYKASPHYAQVLREAAGEVPAGSGVTCATCHMPKVESEEEPGVFHTLHNQNDNLRPNEKMVRSVCLDCHGLQFALDSLADPALIDNNFQGRSKVSIESIQMAIERVKE